METVKCVVLDNKEITGFVNAKTLLEFEDEEELFVIDLDGLNKGAYNLKLYNELSKFFEITVMSFPERTADLVDSIVSGASRVVISSNLPDRVIRDFLTVTEDLVMNYANMSGCRIFSENGGKYYLSNRMVDLPFEKVYLYRGALEKKGYVVLEGFPDFMPTEY
ncbi:hypothetical protein IX51_10870 [uncultured archaeon]|nr:hypothetical protein IX51_10870 [uncultured archaeon]HKJ96787.1 hypothetical protein [Thermoplasmataceae archaeon]